MRARTKRLYAVGVMAILVSAAVALAATALKRHADLFYTPQMLVERGLPEMGTRIRVGGYVEPGSIDYSDGAEMWFTVVDGSGETVRVSYSDIPPDLFREGEGVVATGRFDEAGNMFVAESVLAKHDENYQPRELEDIPAPTVSAS